ncbi:Apolipoprotein/apolipophorin [Pleurostoma richardsiae]|uniref:Apolipoprotein/apolipophorin n=1 Tax=Pleurostoma richardsiae TaxID=41990 RepID=A0AA38S1U9_9PEZI|nr:Apolipoprotein/apolipophorin [Pleurostoma richardsiae]
MYASRPLRTTSKALRAARPARSSARTTRRFQSTSSSSTSSSSTNPALVGGLAGGAVAVTAGYAWYHFSGAKQIVQTQKKARKYIESGVNTLKEKTPEPNEAIDYLRRTASQYAAFVPGAKGYVDTAFDDLDKIRARHGDEVDRIVREAYEELKQVAKDSKSVVSLEAATKAWDVLQKHLKRIGDLASDAAQDILENHPQLKEKLGGGVDQLKAYGENLGPEAKKQVDQTWDQIRDITKSGVSAESVDKARKLVQEKVQQLQKLADDAWQKGLEQAKPVLEKNPKVKQVLEENQDALKHGNLGELWKTVQGGDAGKIEEYVRGQAEKAKQKGQSLLGSGGLEQYLDKIPGGSQIIPKLSELQQVAQKHGKEAEDLLKETVNELQQVLSKKSEEVKKLGEKAANEAK